MAGQPLYELESREVFLGKILLANPGEVAARIIRTVRELSIATGQAVSGALFVEGHFMLGTVISADMDLIS